MASEEVNSLAAEIDTDTTADEILLAATNHDLETLKKLLVEAASAQVQDPDTGFTPLHAAIAACEADDDGDVPETNGAVHKQALDEEGGLETVKLLFENGAIWNDLDNNDETPGCIALRLGLKKIYEAVVEAGVRAELLLARLDAFAPLGDDSDEELDDAGDNKIEGFEPVPYERDEQVANGIHQESIEGFEPQPNAGNAGQTADSSVPNLTQTSPEGHVMEPIESTLRNPNVNSEDYLTSNLEYSGDRLLDSDKNAVMMDWETEIMYKSVDTLVPKPGLRTMNVGFGMGIVDGAFVAKDPAMHHIVEAHPLVMQRMREKGWYEKPNVTIHEGRWQDVLPKLVEQGVVLDAIYFDTYAEDYKDLKIFFQEFVIGLLDKKGLFGFYNGLGADRQICYDIYTRIVEMDLFESGLDTEWLDIQVPDLESTDEWKGVRHKYWDNVNPYRLPTCKFIG